MNIYIKSYLLHCRIEGQSPKTIEGKEIMLNAFNRWCQENDIQIDEVNKIHIKEYINSLIDNIQNSTINSRIKILKTFYSYLVQEGDIKRSPMDNIKLLKTKKNVIQAYSKSSVKELLNYYNNKTFTGCRNKLCIMLLASTGIRSNELRSIKMDDIKGNNIIIRGKGNQDRIVGIPLIVEKQLLTYLKKRTSLKKSSVSDYLIISDRTGKPIVTRTLLRVVHEVGESLGLNEVMTIHNFRRFFAIQSLENNDVYSVSRMLGHNHISTTQIYLQSLNDEKVVQRNIKNNPINNLL